MAWEEEMRALRAARPVRRERIVRVDCERIEEYGRVLKIFWQDGQGCD